MIMGLSCLKFFSSLSLLPNLKQHSISCVCLAFHYTIPIPFESIYTKGTSDNNQQIAVTWLSSVNELQFTNDISVS